MRDGIVLLGLLWLLKSVKKEPFRVPKIDLRLLEVNRGFAN
jgi:hypothetical protein